jgi:hypothetical protein
VRDSKVDKWRGWIADQGRIRNQVLVMHMHRYLWRQFARMLREHGSLPDSYWWEFMRSNYDVTQAVAIRRQADTDPRVITLGRLLTEIENDASRITRPVLAAIWQPEDSWDERDLDQALGRFSGSVGDHVDPAIVAADLDALRTGAAKVSTYVDRHLAHLDSKPVPASDLPTLDDLHAAIDVIGVLFRRYHLLLTSADMPMLVPVIQHSWTAPFRVAWAPPGFRPTSEWQDSQP